MMGNDIKGLKVIYDFITAEQEQELISEIEANMGEPTHVKRGGRSSIKRWGSSKPYNNFVASEILPDYLLRVSQKLVNDTLLTEIPDSISVNQYEVGDYIAAHVDSKSSGETITGLSLLGDCEMVLQKGQEKLIIPLPRRTLIQLSGELRWGYTHCIPPVTQRRFSVIFRNSKG